MTGYEELVNLERARRAARARADARGVLVAAVTARDARLTRCRGGAIEEIETFHAHTPVPPSYSIELASRAPANAMMERQLRVGMRRMLSELSDRIAESAGGGAGVVIGGTPAAVTMAVELLPAALAARVYVDPGLRIPPSASDLRQAAQRGASMLRERQEEKLVKAVLDGAVARGCGVTGREGVERALDVGAVRALVLSRPFVERDPRSADALACRAAAQGASVEEIDGTARERLDAEGNGVAALLVLGLRRNGGGCV
ncbi:MAG TPA: hypothetical protein VFS44_00305 [Gemmatimonadaceae bacterium]|nr:hypothetical protein [Gemmatimonadaceae bacterium]